MRKATRQDIPSILRLLADDMLGSKREYIGDTIPQSYYDAFDAIDANPDQYLAVMEKDGHIIGTLQVSYLYAMSFQGARRAIVEGVHVDRGYRNQGIGKTMMEWVIIEAKKRGCRFVQLTSNKQRKDAHRFYEKLGFVASHEGFKMELEWFCQE